MRKLILLVLLAQIVANSFSQNVGIGTNNPQQKLHVAGNIRADGLAGSSGILKYNTSGDLTGLPNSGNSNQALLGNGNWGLVPGTLPVGAVVASESVNDANLIGQGFVLYGSIPGFTKYTSSSYTASINTWSPTYFEGNSSKTTPPNLYTNDILFWVDSVLYAYTELNQLYIYNPITDSWRFGFLNPTVLTPSFGSKMVWTGTELIVWGGYYTSTTNNGFRYNPTTNTWTAMPSAGQPSARSDFSLEFVNGRLVVWGGLSSTGTLLNDGAVFNLSTNTWSPISTTGAPSARTDFSSVVNTNNNTVIIWGGKISPSLAVVTGDGAIFNPQTNTWAPISSTNAPTARYQNIAVWSGTEMIIHGGYSGLSPLDHLNSGARYNPQTNTWVTTSVTGSPRLNSHTGIWTGSAMLIAGGSMNYSNIVGTPNNVIAYLYNPVSNTWQTASSTTVSKIGGTLIRANNMILFFGGSDMVLNPVTGTYTNFRGLPRGSRFFLAATSIEETRVENLSSLYLYVRQ